MSRHSSRNKSSTGQKALLKSNNDNKNSSISNSIIMNSNKKHDSLIENRIVLESAAIRIQGLVRGQQAHRRTKALRRERETLKKEMEMLIVTGDLPSDHAITLRVEGVCGQLHYLVLSCLVFLSLLCLCTALSTPVRFTVVSIPLYLFFTSLLCLYSSHAFFRHSHFFFLLSFLLLTPCMFRTPPSSFKCQ